MLALRRISAASRVGGAAVAEQPLEDDARVGLLGSGVVGDDHDRLFW